jgi:uncharacterized protein YbbC (DUF1343 family)
VKFLSRTIFCCISATALLAAATASFAAPLKLGNEVLAENGFAPLKGKRVGLLTNPSGVNRNLETTIDILRSAPDVKLVALFGPEHGIYGSEFAGTNIENSVDQRTGLQVFSLYGTNRSPAPEMLKSLDVLVYDLQDTGCRSYTYISTMGVSMQACAKAGVEFVVLDRPNPLGGERVEGPMLHDGFRSMVGKWKVPYVYGMTCGELAQMINGEHWITNACKLTIVPMKGWKRSMVWRDTGLPWVPTSPHVPHGESPLYQVATGMLGEIGGISTGIGYTLPFQCIAGPGLDSHKICDILNNYKLPGVRFNPIVYKPYYFSFKDNEVGGAQVFITDPVHAPLTAINLYALEALKKNCGRDLFTDATNRTFSMFDKVNGTDATRKSLQAGTPASAIIASWRPGEDAFRELRKKYLLY